MEFQSVDLFHCDYLIVDCGHIDRLSDHKDDIIGKTTIESNDDLDLGHGLIFFIDYVPGTLYKTILIQPDVDNVERALMTLIGQNKLSGVQAVCFRQGDCYRDPVEMLREYKHCRGFTEGPCQVSSFKTENGKVVLYQRFDTVRGLEGAWQ